MVCGLSISHRHCAGEAVADAVGLVLAAVETFSAGNGLDRATAHRLAIVVEEVVANVLRHADHGHDIEIGLELAFADDGIRVVLEDDSTPFDPRSAVQAELPDCETGGGVGLSFVRAWAKIEAYAAGPGRNRLTLRLRPRN